MRFRASDVARATGGRLTGPDVELDGEGFDSRSIVDGQLFVPLVVDRDGHEFIAAAVAAGAAAYLTARPADPSLTGRATSIEVDDTMRALGDLARWARTRLPDRVVGITGSVGKTTVKDLTRTVLARRWRTAANVKSYNNDFGLPTTILNASDDTQVLVLEMGMRGFGEIRRLCAIARPTIGIVTAIAEAHTELVGDLAGVARAKAELIEALPSNGTAILNGDQPLVAAMRGHTRANVLTFGTSPGVDVRVRDVVLDEQARPRFTLDTPRGTAEVALSLTGAHMAHNAAAAAAAGLSLEVALDDIAAALAEAQVSPWRMQLERAAVSGALILNDAYNANPTSMRAALEALAAVDADRRVAIVGVMAELADPGEQHARIAELAREQGIELIAVGTDLYGVRPVDDAVGALGSLGGRDAVLVKGSRVAGLERVAERVRSER
jgi:UDP-N-acetylmuramoyl-tripeptide--D-alanyl-D-alanine ligase